MTEAYQTKIACGVILEHEGRIVMVREFHAGEGETWNQPAGHLDACEDLPACTVREAWEETGLRIELTGLLGVYVWPKSPELTWLRVCFIGRPIGDSLVPEELHPQETEPVLEARWFTQAELQAIRPHLRNPMTGRCLDDYYAGQRFPLAVVANVLDQPAPDDRP